jgi:signal transduction histidine kinase
MEQALLDVLMNRSFPDLAAAVRGAIQSVCTRWVDLVRKSFPQADELTFAQVRDDLPVVLEQMARALEVARPAPTERLLEITPKHGEVRFHQSFDVDQLIGEYQLLRPILIDHVTEALGRPLNPEEAVALHAGLDVVVRRSTAAFVEHQTAQLKAATEAQSKYLSFLSHDLRGGLNGVFLMIEVLRRELVKEPKFADSLEDLEMMRRSIFETIGTMDRFLHAERFRKGKVQVKPSRVELGGLIAEVAAQLTYQAKDKGITLQVDRAEPCSAHTDRDLVSMVLQNVLSNAVKYTAKGVVRASARPDKKTGGCLIAVSDPGSGIPKEKLSELFSAFTRGDTHGQPGVGLGLSIARQAADMLGAKLWAESEVGKGSTFYLELPREPVAPEGASRARGIEPAAGAARPAP